MSYVLCLAEGRVINNDDKNENYLLSSFKVSDTGLSALYTLPHLILTTTQCGRYNSYPHFVEEKDEDKNSIMLVFKELTVNRRRQTGKPTMTAEGVSSLGAQGQESLTDWSVWGVVRGSSS